MSAGHCNGTKRVVHSNVYICARACTYEMRSYFFFLLLKCIYSFSIFIWRKRKRWMKINFKSHFARHHLAVCKNPQTWRIITYEKRIYTYEISWWNYVRFSSCEKKKPTMTHSFTVSFTCVQFFFSCWFCC